MNMDGKETKSKTSIAKDEKAKEKQPKKDSLKHDGSPTRSKSRSRRESSGEDRRKSRHRSRKRSASYSSSYTSRSESDHRSRRRKKKKDRRKHSRRHSSSSSSDYSSRASSRRRSDSRSESYSRSSDSSYYNDKRRRHKKRYKRSTSRSGSTSCTSSDDDYHRRRRRHHKKKHRHGRSRRRRSPSTSYTDDSSSSDDYHRKRKRKHKKGRRTRRRSSSYSRSDSYTDDKHHRKLSSKKEENPKPYSKQVLEAESKSAGDAKTSPGAIVSSIDIDAIPLPANLSDTLRIYIKDKHDVRIESDHKKAATSPIQDSKPLEDSTVLTPLNESITPSAEEGVNVEANVTSTEITGRGCSGDKIQAKAQTPIDRLGTDKIEEKHNDRYLQGENDDTLDKSVLNPNDKERKSHHTSQDSKNTLKSNMQVVSMRIETIIHSDNERNTDKHKPPTNQSNREIAPKVVDGTEAGIGESCKSVQSNILTHPEREKTFNETELRQDKEEDKPSQKGFSNKDLMDASEINTKQIKLTHFAEKSETGETIKPEIGGIVEVNIDRIVTEKTSEIINSELLIHLQAKTTESEMMQNKEKNKLDPIEMSKEVDKHASSRLPPSSEEIRSNEMTKSMPESVLKEYQDQHQQENENILLPKLTIPRKRNKAESRLSQGDHDNTKQGSISMEIEDDTKVNKLSNDILSSQARSLAENELQLPEYMENMEAPELSVSAHYSESLDQAGLEDCLTDIVSHSQVSSQDNLAENPSELGLHIGSENPNLKATSVMNLEIATEKTKTNIPDTDKLDSKELSKEIDKQASSKLLTSFEGSRINEITKSKPESASKEYQDQHQQENKNILLPNLPAARNRDKAESKVGQGDQDNTKHGSTSMEIEEAKVNKPSNDISSPQARSLADNQIHLTDYMEDMEAPEQSVSAYERESLDQTGLEDGLTNIESLLQVSSPDKLDHNPCELGLHIGSENPDLKATSVINLEIATEKTKPNLPDTDKLDSKKLSKEVNKQTYSKLIASLKGCRINEITKSKPESTSKEYQDQCQQENILLPKRPTLDIRNEAESRRPTLDIRHEAESRVGQGDQDNTKQGSTSMEIEEAKVNKPSNDILSPQARSLADNQLQLPDYMENVEAPELSVSAHHRESLDQAGIEDGLKDIESHSQVSFQDNLDENPSELGLHGGCEKPNMQATTVMIPEIGTIKIKPNIPGKNQIQEDSMTGRNMKNESELIQKPKIQSMNSNKDEALHPADLDIQSPAISLIPLPRMPPKTYLASISPAKFTKYENTSMHLSGTTTKFDSKQKAQEESQHSESCGIVDFELTAATENEPLNKHNQSHMGKIHLENIANSSQGQVVNEDETKAGGKISVPLDGYEEKSELPERKKVTSIKPEAQEESAEVKQRADPPQSNESCLKGDPTESDKLMLLKTTDASSSRDEVSEHVAPDDEKQSPTDSQDESEVETIIPKDSFTDRVKKGKSRPTKHHKRSHTKENSSKYVKSDDRPSDNEDDFQEQNTPKINPSESFHSDQEHLHLKTQAMGETHDSSAGEHHEQFKENRKNISKDRMKNEIKPSTSHKKKKSKMKSETHDKRYKDKKSQVVKPHRAASDREYESNKRKASQMRKSSSHLDNPNIQVPDYPDEISSRKKSRHHKYKKGTVHKEESSDTEPEVNKPEKHKLMKQPKRARSHRSMSPTTYPEDVHDERISRKHPTSIYDFKAFAANVHSHLSSSNKLAKHQQKQTHSPSKSNRKSRPRKRKSRKTKTSELRSPENISMMKGECKRDSDDSDENQPLKKPSVDKSININVHSEASQEEMPNLFGVAFKVKRVRQPTLETDDLDSLMTKSAVKDYKETVVESGPHKSFASSKCNDNRTSDELKNETDKQWTFARSSSSRSSSCSDDESGEGNRRSGSVSDETIVDEFGRNKRRQRPRSLSSDDEDARSYRRHSDRSSSSSQSSTTNSSRSSSSSSSGSFTSSSSESGSQRKRGRGKSSNKETPYRDTYKAKKDKPDNVDRSESDSKSDTSNKERLHKRQKNHNRKHKQDTTNTRAKSETEYDSGEDKEQRYKKNNEAPAERASKYKSEMKRIDKKRKESNQRKLKNRSNVFPFNNSHSESDQSDKPDIKSNYSEQSAGESDESFSYSVRNESKSFQQHKSKKYKDHRNAASDYESSESVHAKSSHIARDHSKKPVEQSDKISDETFPKSKRHSKANRSISKKKSYASETNSPNVHEQQSCNVQTYNIKEKNASRQIKKLCDKNEREALSHCNDQRRKQPQDKESKKNKPSSSSNRQVHTKESREEITSTSHTRGGRIFPTDESDSIENYKKMDMKQSQHQPSSKWKSITEEKNRQQSSDDEIDESKASKHKQGMSFEHSHAKRSNRQIKYNREKYEYGNFKEAEKDKPENSKSETSIPSDKYSKRKYDGVSSSDSEVQERHTAKKGMKRKRSLSVTDRSKKATRKSESYRSESDSHYSKKRKSKHRKLENTESEASISSDEYYKQKYDPRYKHEQNKVKNNDKSDHKSKNKMNESALKQRRFRETPEREESSMTNDSSSDSEVDARHRKNKQIVRKRSVSSTDESRKVTRKSYSHGSESDSDYKSRRKSKRKKNKRRKRKKRKRAMSTSSSSSESSSDSSYYSKKRKRRKHPWTTSHPTNPKIPKVLPPPPSTLLKEFESEDEREEAKQLYIGHLPPNMNKVDLIDFFNALMKMENMTQGDENPVVGGFVHAEYNYGFIHFDSSVACTQALAFNCITYKGHCITVTRCDKYYPKGLNNVYASRESKVVPKNRIYVGRLPINLGEEYIKHLLSSVGEIRSFLLVMDKETGLNKGFGFVEYMDPNITEEALGILHGLTIGNRKIVANRANQRYDPVTFDYPSKGEMSIAAAAAPGTSSDVMPLLDEATEVLCLSNFGEADLMDVKKECQKFGKVKSLKIPRPQHGESVYARGKYYIEFYSVFDCQKAYQYMSTQKISGKPIKVSFFNPDEYHRPDFG